MGVILWVVLPSIDQPDPDVNSQGLSGNQYIFYANMQRGFFNTPAGEATPELYPDVPVAELVQNPDYGEEDEYDGDDADGDGSQTSSEESIDTPLHMAKEEEILETPSDFDVGEPRTPGVEVNIDVAHQPQRLFDYLTAFDVQWEHIPFDTFHPEFSVGRTSHADFQQVPTGVIKFAMNCEIRHPILPDVQGDSLEDLAGEIADDVPDVAGLMWNYFAISLWHVGETTHFQFLRSESRIEEIESEFLVWRRNSDGTEIPIRYGVAPSLLATRRYNFNPASLLYHDEEEYSMDDTYFNVSAEELHASAAEFCANDQWIRWDVIFALLLANRNCWPQWP